MTDREPSRFTVWLNTSVSAGMACCLLAVLAAIGCFAGSQAGEPPAQTRHYAVMAESMINQRNVDGSGSLLVPVTAGQPQELSFIHLPPPGLRIEYWELASTHEVSETPFPAPGSAWLAIMGTFLCFFAGAAVLVTIYRYVHWWKRHPRVRVASAH